MPNYRFTILIRQDFNWYYIADIISRLIYKLIFINKGWVPDMARVSVNEVLWSGAECVNKNIHIYSGFFVSRVAVP